MWTLPKTSTPWNSRRCQQSGNGLLTTMNSGQGVIRRLSLRFGLRWNLMPPHSVLFWRGPLHNEVRWIDGYNVLVPLEPPMATILESPMMPALEVIEYTTHMFAWFWRGELQEGTVMVPGYRDN